MGGWIERRVYRVTDRNNFKYNFKLCNLFSGRSLVLEGSYIYKFSASVENFLVVVFRGEVVIVVWVVLIWLGF